MAHNGGKKSKHGRSLNKCAIYKAKGQREKNRARRLAKRKKKFAKRREARVVATRL
jgi:hypothetical protein